MDSPNEFQEAGKPKYSIASGAPSATACNLPLNQPLQPSKTIPKYGNRSDSDLLEFSEDHIYYEFWMLYALNKYCHGGVMCSTAEEKLLIENVIVESISMHCRIIIDFLF